MGRIKKQRTGLIKKVVGYSPTKKVIKSQAKRSPTKTVMDGWLTLSMDDHYKETRPLWSDPRKFELGWNPSGLGNSCDRGLVLSVLGYRGDPFSSKLRRIFKRGNTIEAEWIDWFKEKGLWLPGGNITNTRHEPPIIRWKYDLRARHAFEIGRKFMVEIKSINDNGFRSLPPPSHNPETNFYNLTNVPGPQMGPRIRGYVIQLQCYMYEADEPEGMLLFDNKNDQTFLDYFLTLQPGFVEHLYDRLIRLNDNRIRMVVPPCTCEKPSGLFCKHNTNEEVELKEFKELTEVEI